MARLLKKVYRRGFQEFCLEMGRAGNPCFLFGDERKCGGVGRVEWTG